MKFKDIDVKKLFTWWGEDALHTGVKVGDRQAFCLDLLSMVDIHANRDVKEPEPVSEDLTFRSGRNGQAFLCSPVSGGKVLARSFVLLKGEIMHDNDLKPVSTRNSGEEQQNLNEVYITMNLLEKKIKDLETVFQVVKIAIEDRLSAGSSDNRIMSPSVFIKGHELTE